MRRSDSIFEFIDGALDSVQEQELFDEMAQQPELRAELRQYIAIGEAVRADREAFMPPADVERSLMAGLGLAPLAGGGVGAGITWMSRLGALRRMLPLAASFVIGALLAGGGVYMAVTDDRADASAGLSTRDTAFVQTSQPDDTAVATSRRRPVSDALASAGGESQRSARGTGAGTPASSTSSGSVERSSGAASSARSTRYVARAADPQRSSLGADEAHEVAVREDETPSVADELAVDARPVDKLELRESSSPAPVIAAVSSDDLDVRGSIASGDPVASAFDRRKPDDFFIAARRQVSLVRLRETTARQLAQGALDETAIGAFMHVAESSALGIEVGQGRYTQVLVVPEGYVVEGRTMRSTRIEQAPMVQWVGVGYRHFLNDGTGWFNPWVNATAAFGIDNGPILGLRFGGSTPIAGPVSVSAALEGSTLFYMFNGQPLVSAKIGVMAGLQVGF